MIKFNNFFVGYNGNMILKNFSFEIETGEKVLVCGKSGIGKSSLLKAILGFIDFEGDISIEGLNVDVNNIEKIRKLIAYMPQEINAPFSSVKEFFNFSTTWNSTKKGTKKWALEILKRFKIEESLLKKQVSEISGGQKQRILLASCIALDKPILLLDEPDSSMDTENKEIIRDYLLGLDKTILLVSHDMGWSNYMNKIINLDTNG